jgi:hypothetical protein
MNNPTDIGKNINCWFNYNFLLFLFKVHRKLYHVSTIVKTPVKFDLFVQDNGLEFERLEGRRNRWKMMELMSRDTLGFLLNFLQVIFDDLLKLGRTMWRTSRVFDDFGDFMEGRVGLLFYRFAIIRANNLLNSWPNQ